MSETLGQILSAPIVTTTLLGLGVVLVGMWLAATWWAYQDASRRADAELPRWLAAAWLILSGPLLLPFSLGVYVLLRPQEVSADRRTRLLVAAALQASDHSDPRCPACGKGVDVEWARCPSCSLWLARPCERCERLAPVDALLCPFCALELGELPAHEPADDLIAAVVGTAPAAAPMVAPADVPALPVEAPVAAATALPAELATALLARLPWSRGHEGTPGHGRSREDETAAWAGGPVEA